MSLYLKSRMRSFRFAFNGILSLFEQQANLVLHLVATMLVVVLGYITSVSLIETVLLTLCIAAVWTAELFNTAIEKLCDMFTKERDERVRFIKDVAAAAVLLTSAGAVVTGCIIFIPKIILWLS